MTSSDEFRGFSAKVVRVAYIAAWIFVAIYGVGALVLLGHFVEVWIDQTGAMWITEHPFDWNYDSREIYMASLLVSVAWFLPSSCLLAFGLWRRGKIAIIIGLLGFLGLAVFSRTPMDRELTLFLAQFMPAVP
ncbi:MAG: hypothetical protein ACPG06_10635 [Alphaproteobacteria bacterium]